MSWPGDGEGPRPEGGAPSSIPEPVALQILAGRGDRGRLARLWPFLGPAFIASIAYIDPGNIATNVQAGAQFGYRLLWVIVLANSIAMVVQTLTAKLGVASGRNLAQNCRDHFPAPLVIFMWLVSEVSAMATDLAEVLGGALGFHLLFGFPMFTSALLTGLTTVLILALQQRGYRLVEAVLGGLVAVIALCYLLELAISRPSWPDVAYGTFVPGLPSGTLLVAVAIVGATVMPHVVYLHSALLQDRVVPRNAGEARMLMRFDLVDVILAMGLAGAVNLAMLITAAAAFYVTGHRDIGTIEQAYKALQPLLGNSAGTIFGLALLASGVSSSAVGTMAGQVIMSGFVDIPLGLWARRLITMVPALVVIALGVSTQVVIVLSQDVLAFGLPFALVPLLHFTRRGDVMGELVNGWIANSLLTAATIVVLALDGLLIAQSILHF